MANEELFWIYRFAIRLFAIRRFVERNYDRN